MGANRIGMGETMAVVQDWIFSVRYAARGKRELCRAAIVGPARSSTVEAVLHLAKVPEDTRVEIRMDPTVRQFVEGSLDPEKSGYCTQRSVKQDDGDEDSDAWFVCIGSVHEVIR